jgi:hypothetical protein
MASKRKNPTARIGNYTAPIDTTGGGIDNSMLNDMLGTPMDKTEASYVASRSGAPAAKEAVRRARRANKMPPVQMPGD